MIQDQWNGPANCNTARTYYQVGATWEGGRTRHHAWGLGLFGEVFISTGDYLLRRSLRFVSRTNSGAVWREMATSFKACTWDNSSRFKTNEMVRQAATLQVHNTRWVGFPWFGRSPWWVLHVLFHFLWSHLLCPWPTLLMIPGKHLKRSQDYMLYVVWRITSIWCKTICSIVLLCSATTHVIRVPYS